MINRPTTNSRLSISSDTSANKFSRSKRTGGGVTDQTSVTFSVTEFQLPGQVLMVDYLMNGMKLVMERSEYQQDLQVQEQAL